MCTELLTEELMKTVIVYETVKYVTRHVYFPSSILKVLF